MTGMPIALDLFTDTAWMDGALCAQVDPELFHPDAKGGGSARMAKRVCDRCEVLNQCRGYALERKELTGIWGGLTESERRRARNGAEL